jgi:hypothetical protein
LFNPCGDHITHFVGCAEIPYAPNSFWNRKKTGKMSEVGPTMCISFANEGKKQVGWVVTVGRRT